MRKLLIIGPRIATAGVGGVTIHVERLAEWLKKTIVHSQYATTKESLCGVNSVKFGNLGCCIYTYLIQCCDCSTFCLEFCCERKRFDNTW